MPNIVVYRFICRTILAGAILLLVLPKTEGSIGRFARDPAILNRAALTDNPDSRTAVYGAANTEFSVRFGAHVIPYEVFGVYTMPGVVVDVEAVLPQTTGSYELTASAGRLSSTGGRAWQWTAPDKPGIYQLRMRNTASQTTITLNAFVLVPYDIDHGAINGYRIGQYEEQPLENRPAYEPPAGLIEVRPQTRDVHVAPHFTVGDFLAKQPDTYPKYLLLRESLLLKLEMIITELSKRGVARPRLHVMSGYRTPYYNRSIGNRTIYSRHLYGGAADIFVDTDGDSYMDDLTDDGRVNIEDARVLADVIRAGEYSDWYRPFVGGLGVYPATRTHGPFIHVDVRGYRARW